MSSYTAEWILPIAGAPIHHGCFAVQDGRIVAVHERGAGAGGQAGTDAIDLGRVAVLPALVNAHTHLELSHLRGAVPSTERFIDWIRASMAMRREFPDPGDGRIVDAARAAIVEAHASGTGLIGDVSNTLVTVPLLREADVSAQVFYELLRFNAPDPKSMTREARVKADAAASGDGLVRVSLAPHAPYSVSPGLFAAIGAELYAISVQRSGRHPQGRRDRIHQVLRGLPWRALLEELKVWTDAWEAPGTSPVEYLEHLGFLDRRVVAVHGVQLTGKDLDRLSALDMTMVTCPRSNQHVGVGAPPLEAFYAMNVNVAFGTDSLASVEDLNLFSELAAARRIAPRVTARSLLESATLRGASALGFGNDLGSIEHGKRAQLISVRLPEKVGDVEEYLVGGIEPDAIMWLDPA